MIEVGIEKYFRDAAVCLHSDGKVDVSNFKIVRSLFPATAGLYAAPNSRRTIRRLIALLLAATALTACQSQPPTEVKTAGTLIAVAQTFNDNYGKNNDGPGYDRWDAHSQALISRSDYIHRHATCPTAPTQPAHVESAARGPGREWLVRYEISGLQFTDYWFYMRGRWVFDLLLSNPAAGSSAISALVFGIRRPTRLRGGLNTAWR